MTERARLERLAAFVQEFESPGFTFGAVRVLPPGPTGELNMPFAEYSEVAERFLATVGSDGWVIAGFDWSAWLRTPEASALLNDREALARASADDLARLLTAHVRAERFTEGALLDAFQSGLLTAIARRAGTLASAPDNS